MKYGKTARFCGIVTFLLLAVALTAGSSTTWGADDNSNLTPEESYRHLVAGNAAHLGKATDAANALPKLSQETDRFPIATIVYSSDMPVTPETLVNLTSKDVYLVPVELGAFSADNLDEYEYGVMNLRTPVAVVMTHYPSRDLLNFIRQYDALAGRAKAEADKVVAAKSKLTATNSEDKSLQLYNLIGPAIARVREAQPELKGEEFANVVAESIAWQSVEAILMQSSATLDLIRAGSLDLLAAVVDDTTGQIYWLGSHPLQEEFIKPVPEEVKAQKIEAETAFDDESLMTEPLSEEVVDRYITEYQTNNYYYNVVNDYYETPYYYQPCWDLFRPRVWSYRPWWGVWVNPFTPWPYYNPWGRPLWGGVGFTCLHGRLNFFIGFGRTWGPPVHYGPDFRPHDPYWGRDFFRPGPGPGPHPGPGPGPHPGPGPGPHHGPDPIRDMIWNGHGGDIHSLPRGDRPGFQPGSGPVHPNGNRGPQPMDRINDRPGGHGPGGPGQGGPGGSGRPGGGPADRPNGAPGNRDPGNRTPGNMGPNRNPGGPGTPGNRPGITPGMNPRNDRPGSGPANRLGDRPGSTGPNREPNREPGSGLNGGPNNRPGETGPNRNPGDRPNNRPGNSGPGKTGPGNDRPGNTGPGNTRPSGPNGSGGRINDGPGSNGPGPSRNPQNDRRERPFTSTDRNPGSDRGGESPVHRSPDFTGSREVSGPGRPSGTSNRSGMNRGGTSPVYRSPGTSNTPGTRPSTSTRPGSGSDAPFRGFTNNQPGNSGNPGNRVNPSGGNMNRGTTAAPFNNGRSSAPSFNNGRSSVPSFNNGGSSNRPSSSMNRPSPNSNRPSPSMNRPSPSSNRPSSNMNRPSSSSNRPSSSMNRPSPSSNRPSPSMNRPSPSSNRGGAPAARPGGGGGGPRPGGGGGGPRR